MQITFAGACTFFLPFLQHGVLAQSVPSDENLNCVTLSAPTPAFEVSTTTNTKTIEGTAEQTIVVTPTVTVTAGGDTTTTLVSSTVVSTVTADDSEETFTTTITATNIVTQFSTVVTTETATTTTTTTSSAISTVPTVSRFIPIQSGLAGTTNEQPLPASPRMFRKRAKQCKPKSYSNSTVSSVHYGGDAFPTGGEAYPTGGEAYPTGGAAYPTGGQAYPTGGQAYPTGGEAYPTGSAGYPGGSQAPCLPTGVYENGYPSQVICETTIGGNTATITSTAQPTTITASNATVTQTSTELVTSTTTIPGASATTTVTSSTEVASFTTIVADTQTTTVTTTSTQVVNAPAATVFAACENASNFASFYNGYPITNVAGPGLDDIAVAATNPRDCCNSCFADPLCGTFAFRRDLVCYHLKPQSQVCDKPDGYPYAIQYKTNITISAFTVGNGPCIQLTYPIDVTNGQQ